MEVGDQPVHRVTPCKRCICIYIYVYIYIYICMYTYIYRDMYMYNIHIIIYSEIVKAGLGIFETNVRIGLGWVLSKRTCVFSGIQFTRYFIKFVVVETKQIVSSNTNVILTRQTCGQRSERWLLFRFAVSRSRLNYYRD